jgi:hypothetical protein
MALGFSKLAAWSDRMPDGAVEIDNGPRGVCVRVSYRRRPAWFAAGVLTTIALVFVAKVYNDNSLDYQVSAMTIVVILGLLFLAVVSILPHPVETMTLVASPLGLESRSNVHRLVVRNWPRDRIQDVFVRPWERRGKRKESLELGVRLTDGSDVLLGFATPQEAEAMTEALRRGLGIEPAPEEDRDDDSGGSDASA